MGEKNIIKSAGIVSVSPVSSSMCGVVLNSFAMPGKAGETSTEPKIVIIAAPKRASLKRTRSVRAMILLSNLL